MPCFKNRNKLKPPCVQDKTARLLKYVCLVFVFLGIRVWFLSVIQHEDKLAEARRPQKRTIIEKAERACICDVSGVILAANKPKYKAVILYNTIRELPGRIWIKDDSGKKKKIFFRKQYIKNLSQKIAKELDLDAIRIDDLIHSKASITGNIPFVIKDNLTEEQFYKILALEKSWPGLRAEIQQERYYPKGSVVADIIGYIGPINLAEYKRLTKELKILRDCVSSWEEGVEPCFPDGLTNIDEVHKELLNLEKKSYSLSDTIGKAGIECFYDYKLRGEAGKSVFLVDRRGSFIREEEVSAPSPGPRLRLSMSYELQEFADQLLSKYEAANQHRYSSSQKNKSNLPVMYPWIKGGAIVALNPKTGDVLACASSPAWDPNDFVTCSDSLSRNKKIKRWLETDSYIEDIWNFCAQMQREKRGLFSKEKQYDIIDMTWVNFLNFILPENSLIKQTLVDKGTLFDAYFVQNVTEEMISLFSSDHIHVHPSKIIDYIYKQEEGNGPLDRTLSLIEKDFLNQREIEIRSRLTVLRKKVEHVFKSIDLNYDKLLLIDLYRLALDHSKFAIDAEVLKNISINNFRSAEGAFVPILKALKSIVFESFKSDYYNVWRDNNFCDYLKSQRKIEIEQGKKHPKPYIEYLDQGFEALFNQFFDVYKWDFIAVFFGLSTVKREIPYAYNELLENWRRELCAGAHQGLDWVRYYHLFMNAVSEFPENCDIIKICKNFREFKDLNRSLYGFYPWLSEDRERALAKSFYPKYGFGFLTSNAFSKTATPGSIFKVVTAYTALSQQQVKYGPMIANNLLTMIDQKNVAPGGKAMSIGFFDDGSVIPICYKGGRLPKSEFISSAKLDLLKAIEMSSNPYFSILAGDIIDDPEDLSFTASLFGFGSKSGLDVSGEVNGTIPGDLSYNKTGLYAVAIGQHSLSVTPLQVAVCFSAIVNGGIVYKPKLLVGERFGYEDENIIDPIECRRLFMPKEVSSLLIKGMHNVIVGERGTARSLKNQFSEEVLSKVIGKTSTAEIMERVSMDKLHGVMKLKHAWFVAIGFEDESLVDPEIVVVVFLRVGNFGKDAAPLAIEMIEKWRKIKEKL